MSKRVTPRFLGSSQLRTRVAVLAAGAGVTAMAGAGIASAADSGSIPGISASSVQAQADAQAKAAHKAAEKAAQAKKDAAAKAASWVDPVKSYTLSASYGTGGDRWASKHSGQDFAVPVGTKVMAAHGGTVVKAGGNGAGDGPAYGNAVVVKHDNNTYTQYAHLSRVDVKVGESVKTGEEIAKSGNTGNSSGPHLHFEVRKSADYGTAVDPVAALKAEGVKV